MPLSLAFEENFGGSLEKDLDCLEKGANCLEKDVMLYPHEKP